MPAALKTLAKRGCKGALPDAIAFKFPPSASRHLLNINLLASLSWD